MAEEIIIVQGNNTLAGDVAVSGAKNSALKLIAAALLGQGETTIHNVPLISDISIMSDVLRCLGARVERDGHTLTVDTSAVDKHETPYELVSKMRASISVLGPLVGRFGCARVAMPGRLSDRRSQDRHASCRASRLSAWSSPSTTASLRPARPTGCTARTSYSTSPVWEQPRTCSWPPWRPRAPRS